MPKRILIIDDDPDVLLFLATILKDNGYEIVEALNGEEGMEKIRSDRPDLVLLDLMMPQKSGIAVFSEVSASPELREIPVVMVTGVAGETGIDLEAFFSRRRGGEDEISLKPAGYIEKPVDPEQLVKLVKELIA